MMLSCFLSSTPAEEVSRAQLSRQLQPEPADEEEEEEEEVETVALLCLSMLVRYCRRLLSSDSRYCWFSFASSQFSCGKQAIARVMKNRHRDQIDLNIAHLGLTGLDVF